MLVSVVAQPFWLSRLPWELSVMAMQRSWLKSLSFWKSLSKNGVTGELCLTSNLQTKAAVTVDDFPYLKMKMAGANITINTDNRTVSDTNLTKSTNSITSILIAQFKTSMLIIRQQSKLHLLVMRRKKNFLKNWLKPIHKKLLDW